MEAYPKGIDVVGRSFHRRIESRHVPDLSGIPTPFGQKGQVAEAEMPLHPHRIQQSPCYPAPGELLRESGRAVPRLAEQGNKSGQIVMNVLALELYRCRRRVGTFVHYGLEFLITFTLDFLLKASVQDVRRSETPGYPVDDVL